MGDDLHRRDLAIDRFWNALVTGTDDPDPAGLDNDTAAQIRRLHTLVHAQTPAGAQARLERAMERVHPRTPSTTNGKGAATEPMNGVTTLAGPFAPGVPGQRPRSGIPRPLTHPARPGLRERRWGLAAGAVAALLLILGAGYVLFGSDLLDDDRPKTVPAAVAPTATPTPDVRSEGTVVEFTIPAAVLPAGVAGSALEHETILPGTRSTWTIPQNAILRYIVAGTLTVRSDTPVSLLSGGARTWTDVAPGTDIELGPGDTILFLYPTTFEIENAEATPVEMVGWIIESGTVERNPIPSDWVINDYALSGGGGVTTTGGPAVLRLQRTVLAPREAIPAAPEGVLQLVIAMPDNGAGTPVASWGIQQQPGGKADNWGTDPILVYVLTLTFGVPEASPSAGTPPP
jgi:hypothetical protein